MMNLLIILKVPEKNLGSLNYEEFLKTGDENFEWSLPIDEWDSLALNYTSGTTGLPKGVVYHHRGAYLMSTGSSVAWNMPNQLNFLTNCTNVSL